MSGLPIVKFRSGSPSCSLHNLRVIVGKSASQLSLLDCFQPKDNRIHWVINSYFRNLFHTGKYDDYRLRCSKEVSSLVILMTMALIPLELVLKLLSYLDCYSLIQMSSTNRFYRTELLLLNKFQSALWSSLLKNYCYVVDHKENGTGLVIGGSWMGDNIPSPSFHIGNIGYHCIYDVDMSEDEELNFFLLFKKCFIAELNFRCVCCTSKTDSDRGSIIPILYGYPSSSLVNFHLSGVIALGGDYLLEGASNWRCRTCKAEFYAYPYHCGWMELQ